MGFLNTVKHFLGFESEDDYYDDDYYDEEETEDEENDFQNLHGGLLRRIGLQCLQ